MRSSTIVLVSLAVFTLALFAATAKATPIAITNGDFEATGGATTGVNWNTVHNWTEEVGGAGPEYVHFSGTAWTPQATQVLYLNATSAAVNQDLSHNWASTDVFTLAFDAYEPGWRIATAGDAIRAQLRETDGTVLWDSGSLNLDGTVTGSENNFSFTGTGHQYSYNIDASTFAGVGGAVEGSTLNLRMAFVGGVAFADNVTLDVIPEPSTFTLAAFGLIGLLGFYRRK